MIGYIAGDETSWRLHQTLQVYAVGIVVFKLDNFYNHNATHFERRGPMMVNDFTKVICSNAPSVWQSAVKKTQAAPAFRAFGIDSVHLVLF